MTTFLQMLTALFAVVGLFETVWQITLRMFRKEKKGKSAQLILVTDETTDPAFLAEDLRILSNHLTTKEPLRIWLVCPSGAPQERVCRHVAQQFDTIRIVAPDRLTEEVRAFVEER